MFYFVNKIMWLTNKYLHNINKHNIFLPSFAKEVGKE